MALTSPNNTGNASTSNGTGHDQMALHMLAGSSSITALDAAKKLLDSGRFPVNWAEPEWSVTPLHVAANWGNLAMVQLLVHYGADPMMKDDEGNTTFDLTEDKAVLKFLDQMTSVPAKDKNRMLKMIREVFGIKMETVGSSKKKKKSKKNRPVSCFPAFEPIKEPTAKRRSEQIRHGFGRVSDEQVSRIIQRIDMVNVSGIQVKSTPRVGKPESSFKKSISNRDFPSRVVPKAAVENDAVSLGGELINRLEKLTLDAGLGAGARNGGIQTAQVGHGLDKGCGGHAKSDKKRRVRAAAVTNEGEEFEFDLYLSSSSSTSDVAGSPFKKNFSAVVTPASGSAFSSMSSIYPKIEPLAADEAAIIPPQRVSSLDLNTPVSRPQQQHQMPPLPQRHESIRTRTPTAPPDSEGEDEVEIEPALEAFERMVVVDLPATPEVSKEIRQLSLLQLKKRLETVGISPGPLQSDNRKFYEKKLASFELQKTENYQGKTYSNALERFIRAAELENPSRVGLLQEDIIRNEFCAGQVITREKNEVSSFCYLLVDPSMIKDQFSCSFKEFIEAVFYVGKGKRSRPLQHLIDAAKSKRTETLKGKPVSDKLKRICRLWRKGHGVISLQVFTNIHPNEAYIREGAMIDAFGLKNLTNLKGGEYSGHAKEWTLKDKTEFGVYCLNSAWRIFRHDRCRPVFESDVDDAINSPKMLRYH